MASVRVLAFDHEGRPIQFDTWLDELQLYLLSDSRDNVSLFHHTSGASLAPPATADSASHSQWLTRDAAARLAIRNHLLLAECAHFGQHRTAQTLYDAIVAHYSSSATAALGRLLLPYLFPELSAFATVEDLLTHIHTCDARYHAALSAEFLDRNPPPMFITLYFIVTRLLDLLEQHLLGVPPPPLPPPTPLLLLLTSLVLRMSGLLLLVGSAAAARARVAGVVAVAAGVVVGAALEVVEAVEVVAVVGVVAGVGALAEVVVAVVGVAVIAAVGVVAKGLELLSGEILVVARGSSSSVGARPRRPSSFVSGFLNMGRLGVVLAAHDAWHAEFGDDAERPRWAELLRSGVAIFDLDYDAILAAMYALSVSAEGDCYLYVPPDPGIEAAALGASESALPGTAPAEALHTFTLDSGASHCFFHDRTNLTPLSTPVPVRLADPSGGPILARSSTILPCPAVPSGSLSGLHLPSFSTNLVSTAAFQDAMVTTTTPGGLCLPSRPRLTLPSSLLLVSPDDYTRYTTVFPLRCKGESFMLLASPQQNGVAERCIGLVMEVARTSMIHAVAPHFQWLFAVRYAAHQLNLWPRVSLPETSPTLRWTRQVGSTSVFRVWGSHDFVHDMSADKISAHAIPWVFLGFPPDAPGWQFYHPTSRHVLSSRDAMFDDSVPFYRVSQVDPVEPVEVAVDSGTSRGAASGGAEPAGVGPGGTEPACAEPGVAESEGAEPGGAEPERGFSACLQGPLHEEIWLRRPVCFTGSFSASAQWSLRRPVYGLCQAPLEWHNTLRTTLAALGFAPSIADPSLFLCTDASLPPFYVLVYVDDLVFATADTEALALLKSELQKRETCTDLGELRSYLGLQITRDRARRTITLTQSHMVHQVLQRFGFRYSSP
ncbi:unnamed protein product [Closterium sp. NIES-53]